MADPANLDFASTRKHFGALELSLAKKAAIEASFAWLAELHQAGRIVSAVDALEYLVARLGLSRGEAPNRLRKGRAIYAPGPVPPPAGKARRSA